MDGNIREILRKNLAKYINESDMTQKEIAERLGVSKGAITNYLQGSNSPNIEILAKLCQIFEVRMSDMLSEKSDITSSEKDFIRKYRQLTSHGKQVVDTVLDIEYNYSTQTVKVYKAAKSDDDHNDEIVEMSKSELEFLQSQPFTDEEI